MTSINPTNDGAVLAPVHSDVVQDVLLQREVEGWHEGLRAALDAGDVAALKALALGLEREGALSLILHTRRQAKAAAAGRFEYGAQAWGSKPPLRVLEATLRVRAALLRSRSCGLSQEDARRVVRESITAEIEAGRFWRFPLAAIIGADARRAAQLLYWRNQALQSQMLADSAGDLSRIHAATLDLLRQAGLDFELLGRYAQGARGEADAVSRLAASEAHDARALADYWRDTLGR